MENLNRLKAVLADAGQTNKWLAEQLGKDPVTISKWCTNTTQPEFKHPEDAPLLFRTLMHIGCGIVDEIEGVSDFDRIVCEMENILKMLKYHFYKEEYLL